MNLWMLRSPQERKLLLMAGGVALLALYAWLLHTGSAALSTLEQSVPVQRMQAARLAQHAEELLQLHAMAPVATSDIALLTLLQTEAAKAGLADLLVHSAALDADKAALTFGAIPFDTWLRWIAGLQLQNVHVVSARIEALATPGLASVTATLARPVPQ